MRYIDKIKSKLKKLRFYSANKALRETNFKIGKHFKYVVNPKSGKMFIVPSDEKTRNRVSKKGKKEETPLIDIRNKKALSIFEGCDSLEITVYKNQLVVEGFVEEKEEQQNTSFVSKAKNAVGNLISRKATVTHIEEKRKLKRKAIAVFSKKQLKQVVGDNSFQQLSIFDFEEAIASSGIGTTNNSKTIQKLLEGIKVTMDVVSLFSGAGLLDFAFRKAGFNIVKAIERSEGAGETYKYNFGGEHLIVGDISEVDDSEIEETDAHGVIAGIPCTSFTSLNQHTRLQDHPDFFAYKEFIRKVKALKNCHWWVIENVEEFVTALDGYCLKELKKDLPDFEITVSVLNAADYGAAMIRQRVIIFGSKMGKIDAPEPTVKPENYKTVGEAFEGLTEDIPNMQDFNKHKELTIERMKTIPQGGNHWDIPEHLRRGLKAKFSDYHKRLCLYKPSVSLVHVRKNLITHPILNRVLSVRECARLMGLPDDFIFFGPKDATKGEKTDSMQQQVANGVVVSKGYAIAMVIRKVIEQFNIRNRTEQLVLL